MSAPGEYNIVQSRILKYAQQIGWTYVPRGAAEQRRGFDPAQATPAEQAAAASPYFDDLLDAQMRTFNPAYAEGPGALVGDLRCLHADIAVNRDFLACLRNAKTFYDHTAGRELNLVLIDYDQPENNLGRPAYGNVQRSGDRSTANRARAPSAAADGPPPARHDSRTTGANTGANTSANTKPIIPAENQEMCSLTPDP